MNRFQDFQPGEWCIHVAGKRDCGVTLANVWLSNDILCQRGFFCDSAHTADSTT